MPSLLNGLKGQGNYVDRLQVPDPHVSAAPPFLSWGWHLCPLFYCIIVATTVITNLVMYEQNNRVADWPRVCLEIDGDAESTDCDPKNALKFPTISRTASWDPEYYIALVGWSLAGIVNLFTVYHVHRSSWGRASYLDSINVIKPRAYCMPFCITPRCRPRLTTMLYVTEAIGYAVSFWLVLVAIFSMRINNAIHNLAAFAFFACYLLYVFLFTLNQHNIKNKCLANFPSPWRYVWKVVLLGTGMMVFVIVVGIFMGLYANPCFVYETSDFRRRGFGLFQYIACLLCGLWSLTHIEDIRQENTSKVLRDHAKIKIPGSESVQNPTFDAKSSTGGVKNVSVAESKFSQYKNVAPMANAVVVTISKEVASNVAEGLPATRRLHGKKIVESKPSHFRGLASDGVSGVPEFQLADDVQQTDVYSKPWAKSNNIIGKVLKSENGGRVHCLSGNGIDFIRIEWPEGVEGYAWVKRTENGQAVMLPVPQKLDGASKAGY